LVPFTKAILFNPENVNVIYPYEVPIVDTSTASDIAKAVPVGLLSVPKAVT
jgi:hypothetical protein